MKKVVGVALTSIVPMTSACLVACASLSRDGSDGQAMPSPHAVQTALQPSMGYYENAVEAIDGQHYALALEYLQAARAVKPDDVRVLTAFGVVYDKLGRFDLSARYYAQASALEPKSTIVAHDIEYSRILQGMISTPAPVLARKAPAAEGARVPVLASAPSPLPATASPASLNGSLKAASAAPESGPAPMMMAQDATALRLQESNGDGSYPVTAPVARQVVPAHDVGYSWTSNSFISAPIPLLANAQPLTQQSEPPVLPKAIAPLPQILNASNGNVPWAAPVPKEVLARDVEYPQAGLVYAPAPVLANAQSAAEQAASEPPKVVLQLPAAVNAASGNIAPASRQVPLAHDVELTWAGVTSASAPVLAKVQLSMQQAPTAPKAILQTPSAVSAPGGNMVVSAPVPRRVVLAHDVEYHRTASVSALAPMLAKSVPSGAGTATRFWSKSAAPLSAVASVAAHNIPVAAPALRSVAVTRHVEYAQPFARPGAAAAPVTAEARLPASLVKLPAVPKSPMPQSAHLMPAKADMPRPIAIGHVDWAQQWTKATRIAKSGMPETVKTVSLTGHQLIVVNAAGRRDAGTLVRAYLSGRGWSVSKDIKPLPQAQPQTAVYFPASMVAIAQGLINTLSLRAKLIASPNQIGVKIVLGRDAASPLSVGRLTRAQYRRVAISTLKVHSPE